MAARLLSLAFYLPQFHAIPENDRWWGPGFTEWTHLARAGSWHAGHAVRQPIAPLGRYDLLDPATIEAQQALASAHGIDGFLVWNYWFGGGRQLLERPTALMHAKGLKVRYAFAWANHDWVDKLNRRLLVRQQYRGASDYAAYFMHCLPHFRSEQYVKVDGKPFFFIYRPEHLPDLQTFVKTWRALAVQHGLPGLYLVGDVLKDRSVPPPGLDAYSCAAGFWAYRDHHLRKVMLQWLGRHAGLPTRPPRYDFTRLLRHSMPAQTDVNFIPTVLTGWDTTPRHGRHGVVVDGLTPDSFRTHLRQALPPLLRQTGETRIVLLKSWNEWAEGNLLEPDSVYGDALLREYLQFSVECRQALARATGPA